MKSISKGTDNSCEPKILPIIMPDLTVCYARAPAMLQRLSGSQMLLFKDKINYKAPNGNGFTAHLDAPAYNHICKVEHLTINIAIDDATPANGCVEVVVGSHKMNVTMIGHNIDPKSKMG